MAEYAIELKGITKRFPGVVANNNISFSVEKGEIHALAGENGAGKSTLMNILFGLLVPDEGEIVINGKVKKFSSPRDSNAAGIGMVHQHFMLIPKMSVMENVIIGQEPGSSLKIDRQKGIEEVQAISDRYELNLDVTKRVGDLSVPEQQRVEILKVLYRQADILIFDEPTAVLPPHLIDEFCDILLSLKQKGKTIIFISHKLAEVMKVSDHVTVIRRGEVIGTKAICDTSIDDITRMMVGHSVDTGRKERSDIRPGKEVLTIKDLHYTNIEGNEKLKGLDLTVHEGEIVGIAGVDGNGQEEMEKCILGLFKPDSGEILFEGRNVNDLNVRQRRDMGLGYVAEDRQKESLVLQYSVAYNLVLGQEERPEYSKNGFWLKRNAIQETAERLAKDYDIRLANVNVAAGTLSGGNQQKIVIAREANADPSLYVAIQPTRGLDIGAADSVQDTLIRLRDENKAVLLISMELDEVLAVSDRIAVIFDGRIVAVVDAATADKESIGYLMLGSRKGGEK